MHDRPATATPPPAQPIAVRAVDYLVPEPAPEADSALDSDGLPQITLNDNHEGLVRRLFGAVPDYRRPEFEQLWQEVNATFRAGIYAYCRARGVDVLDGAGQPVRPWRDIAVMLMAEERGLFARAR